MGETVETSFLKPTDRATIIINSLAKCINQESILMQN